MFFSREVEHTKKILKQLRLAVFFSVVVGGAADLAFNDGKVGENVLDGSATVYRDLGKSITASVREASNPRP